MRTFSHHEDHSYADFKRIQEEVRTTIHDLCNCGSIIEFEKETCGKIEDMTRQINRSN